MKACRFRFPWPYVGYRDRLGEIVRALRRDLHRELGREDIVSQAELARMVGVTRETISRIETGSELPAPATAEKLLTVFGKEWRVFGETGTAGNHPPFLEGERMKWLAEMGEDLKRGREREGLKLWQVAERCGLSVAQLSRIERGQTTRSKVIREELSYKGEPFGDRAVWFKNDELERLEQVGRRIERVVEPEDEDQFVLPL